jgi:hypothetical protein
MSPLVPLMWLKRKTSFSTSSLSDEQVESMYKSESDLPAPFLNVLATAVLRAENFLFAHFDIGFGSSLIGVGKKSLA